MGRILNRKCLSPQMQQLIGITYSAKLCCFESQDVYKDAQAFHDVAGFLERNGIFKKEVVIVEGKFRDKWRLTWDGMLLWEEFLRNLK